MQGTDSDLVAHPRSLLVTIPRSICSCDQNILDIFIFASNIGEIMGSGMVRLEIGIF